MRRSLQLLAALLLAGSGCTKTEVVAPPAAAQNRILEYKIVNVQGDPVYGAVNDTDSSITLHLPFYKQLTILEPEITLSEGATVKPATGTLIEDVPEVLRNGRDIKYTVTGKDGTVKTYTLKLAVQQPAMVVQELSTDAATPAEFTIEMAPQVVSSFSFNIIGEGFSENLDLMKVMLVDAAGKEIPGVLDLSITNTNNLNSIGVFVSVYYDAAKQTYTIPDVLKNIPQTGLYRVRVYNYAKVATMQFPIRITKN